MAFLTRKLRNEKRKGENTMPSIIERARNIWDLLRQGPAQLPTRASLPHDHVDDGRMAQAAFQPDQHYFQVRINEMYLKYSREWFNKYDPMVFVVSEFTYDKKVEAVPFVVGPQMMEKFGQNTPTGMIFSDTRVAGIHPYRGGRLTLSVVLCRVLREDYARNLLHLVDSATSALDFSTALSTYVKIAGVVLDGVEAVLGLGNTNSIIGLRKEFDPDAGDALVPDYFALIDIPQSGLNPDHLWVRKGQLLSGNTFDTAQPFRDADYLLYSIAQVPERSDITTLPFYPLYERVKQEAASSDESSWKRAKADMLALYQTLVLSPDVTPKQADQLNAGYIAEIKCLHKRALALDSLGPAEGKTPSEVDAKLEQAVDILNL